MHFDSQRAVKIKGCVCSCLQTNTVCVLDPNYRNDELKGGFPGMRGEYILNRSFPCNLIHHFTICSSLPPPSSFFFLSLFSPYHFFPPSLIFLPIFLFPNSSVLDCSWVLGKETRQIPAMTLRTPPQL